MDSSDIENLNNLGAFNSVWISILSDDLVFDLFLPIILKYLSEFFLGFMDKSGSFLRLTWGIYKYCDSFGWNIFCHLVNDSCAMNFR